MTHVDDLYEPEPPVRATIAGWGLSLEEIEAALAIARRDDVPPGRPVAEVDAALKALAYLAIPQLLAEVRELRADQERWRSLEAESRFLVTAGPPPGPGVPVDAVTREAADVIAMADPDAFPGATPAVWARHTYSTAWERHVPPLMTHVTGLVERGDDCGPEPPDSEPAMSSAEIEAVCEAAMRADSALLPDSVRRLLREAVPQMLAQLTVLLAERERWRAMPAHWRYCLTAGYPPRVGDTTEIPLTPEGADSIAAAGQPHETAWRQPVYTGAWERHQVAPF